MKRKNKIKFNNSVQMRSHLAPITTSNNIIFLLLFQYSFSHHHRLFHYLPPWFSQCVISSLILVSQQQRKIRKSCSAVHVYIYTKNRYITVQSSFFYSSYFFFSLSLSLSFFFLNVCSGVFISTSRKKLLHELLKKKKY